jgi:hypothetical protein
MIESPKYGKRYKNTGQIEKATNVSQHPLFRSRLQAFDGGQAAYNSKLEERETDFAHVYHDVWRIFFTPSPPVAQTIVQVLNDKGLTPGHYISAHVRALYGKDFETPKLIQDWTKSALNCASHLRNPPGSPIFLASDSDLAADFGVDYGASQHRAKVVTHESHPNPPLHLDSDNHHNSNNQTKDDTIIMLSPTTPSDYYDTFVDLYLLSLGGCVFTTKGFYGSWALLIGGNVSCTRRQRLGKRKTSCQWNHQEGKASISQNNATQQAVHYYLTRERLFAEPMAEWASE